MNNGLVVGHRRAARPTVRVGQVHPVTTPGEFFALRGGDTGSGAITNLQSRCCPFMVTDDCVIDRLGLNVTVIGAGTGGAGTKVVRLGIRRDNGRGRPGDVLLDAGTIAADAVANASIAVNQPLRGLTPYYLVSQVEGCDTTGPTVSYVANGAEGVSMIAQPVANPAACYTQTATAGVIPSAAPTGNASIMPMVWARLLSAGGS